LGFGVGGLGPTPQPPIPNPQSPIPNPHLTNNNLILKDKSKYKFNFINNIKLYVNKKNIYKWGYVNQTI
jgi:hypothetical protein